jgi:hypothetical protein
VTTKHNKSSGKWQTCDCSFVIPGIDNMIPWLGRVKLMPVAFEAMSQSHATYTRLIASVAPLFSHVRLSMTTSDLQKQPQGILP